MQTKTNMQIHEHDKIKTNIHPPNLVMSTPLIDAYHLHLLVATSPCRGRRPRCRVGANHNCNLAAALVFAISITRTLLRMVAMATYTGLRISRSFPPLAASTSHGSYRHCDLHISWSLPSMHHHCYHHHRVIAPCLRRARHRHTASVSTTALTSAQTLFDNDSITPPLSAPSGIAPLVPRRRRLLLVAESHCRLLLTASHRRLLMAPLHPAPGGIAPPPPAHNGICSAP